MRRRNRNILGKAIVFLALCAMCGCASPIRTATYTLPLSPASTDVAQIKNSSDSILHISKISLPDYLKQPGIALILPDGSTHFAAYHRWAEPLSYAIARSLVRDLSSELPSFRVTNDEAIASSDAYILEIDIEDFRGSQKGRIVLQGRWTLIDPNSSTNARETAFSLETYQDRNGYSALIAGHGTLLRELAKEIAGTLK